jgi:hypothetical protein
MTDLRTAAQQALEALEQSETSVPYEGFGMLRREAERKLEATINDLRAALEQPEQEPVANNPDPYHLSRILHELAGSASMCWEHVDRAGVFQSTQAADVVAAAIAEIRQRMKDAPPRREWRGLSEGALMGIYMDFDRKADKQWTNAEYLLRLMDTVQAKLKELNHHD